MKKEHFLLLTDDGCMTKVERLKILSSEVKEKNWVDNGQYSNLDANEIIVFCSKKKWKKLVFKMMLRKGYY